MKNIKNIEQKLSHHAFNARLLYKELQNRKIKLSALEGTKYFTLAFYNSHLEMLYGVTNSALAFSTGTIIDDKYYVKKYLEMNGFNVLPGRVFTEKTLSEALEYAEALQFPVVLKPTTGSHGDFVLLDIKSKKELKQKINYFLKQGFGNGFYLIEKQYTGDEYRLFITKKGYFAAVSRIPANITGDGKHTVRQLVELENYRRMHPRATCLCEIPFDQVTKENLKQQGIAFNSILKKKQKVFLRKNSNVSTGGNCHEITKNVHPDFIKLAKNILSSFGDISFIGIDIMCKDITKPLKNYIICELNSTPGLSLHMLPENGKPRNVAAAIVDTLFPETI
jgi:D-alanine-D-alanine ligase-like ATP-grasp enzyme